MDGTFFAIYFDEIKCVKVIIHTLPSSSASGSHYDHLTSCITQALKFGPANCISVSGIVHLLKRNDVLI